MPVDTVVLTAGAGFIVVCLGVFWWASRESVIGQRHTILVFAWLCAALAAALVIFSAFPASQADGTVFGVTVGGAGAFVLLVWTAALRAANRAGREDAKDAELRRKEKEIRELRRQLAQARARQAPTPISLTEVELYRLSTRTMSEERRIGLVTGDLRNVKCADVWVNTENTDMEMSRVHEFSISAIIRYEGARRDESGQVVEDLVADELRRKVAGRTPVAAGTAIVTGSGELARRNAVRYLIHVAAVQGEPGAGFRQVREVGRCVTNALMAAQQLASDDRSVKTLLFPILGAGQGNADLATTVRALIDPAIDHLAAARHGRIRTVYFLAYTDAELAACRAVLAGHASVAARP